MEDPNISTEEYIMLEEEKAHRRAIAFNDTLMSEPMVSSLYNNEIDFRISFDESDDEDCMDNDDDKVYIEHSSRNLSVKPLPNVINTDSEKDNDDNEVDIIQSSGGNVMNTDDAAYAQRIKWTTPTLLWNSISGLRKKKLENVGKCLTGKPLSM
nr:hypothetical protein [Tanacetum cinerariifolium]